MNAQQETAAHVLIFNAASEVLVLTLGKHLKHPEKSYTPDLPGGIVEPNEAEMTAAIRETEEEAGIKVTNLSLAYTRTYLTSENTSVIRLLYITRLSETPEVKLSWEHSDYAWVPLKDFSKVIQGRRFFKEAVEYCVEHGLV